MSDCYLGEGEKQISLYYLDEESLSAVGEVHQCLKALKELESIVQPLSVEFCLKYRHKRTLALKRDLKDLPEFPFWHWEISSIPPEIVTEGFYFGGAKVIPVEDITSEELSQWIIEPLQQKSPDPEYEICWDEINICAVRARIIDENVIDEIRCVKRDYYLVSTRYGEYRFPLVRHNEGLWVYGPHEGYRGYPPMTIRFLTEFGGHKLKFSIPWTVWYDEHSPEYFYFYQAVQRIIAQGWELSEQTPMKEPKYTDKGKLKFGSIDDRTETSKLESLTEQLNQPSTPKKKSSTEKIELNSKTESIQEPEPQVQESPSFEQQRQEKQAKLESITTRLSQINREMKRLDDRIKNLSGGSYDRSIHSRIKELKAKSSKLIGEKNQLEREKANLEREIEKINQNKS